jgi:hypothetical protein
MASSPADKARAGASAALECVNKKMDPSCTECTDIPPVRAIILYPNLGTPLILPPDEKKLNFFIAAEGKSRTLFGVAPGTKQFPAPASVGYMYVDKHLRVYPISAKKLKEDTKDGRLWKDGKVCGTAFQHVKVWCLGRLDEGTIRDIVGTTVANIRPKTIEGYNATEPAHADPKDPLARNEPLEWLYQIQIDLDALPDAPTPGKLVSLAWMIGMPLCYKKQKELAGIDDWEYQDKLIYDFLEAQKKNPKKLHVPDLYEFDVTTAASSKFPKLKREAPRRLKAWHPVMIGKNATLRIGHLTDVHVNSRQFALASSNACVIEGFSGKIGTKVDNCFMALKELFENMKTAGADAIFLTGDLLDFNRNLDPRQLTSSRPKDQWHVYNLAENINDGKLYPRGIDDMLLFSLLRYSYEKLHMPVYITTGNHEAYDVPYGISPRANPFVAKRAIEQINSDHSVAIPARLRAAGHIISKVGRVTDSVKNIPFIGPQWERVTDVRDELLKKALKKLRVTTDPNNIELVEKKMNEGIPADHNLTIYESCLIYGPSFPQVVKPFNFTPDNFDWFFTLFTPLADYRIDYHDQVLVGLDWGDSEIMVNLDISRGELGQTPKDMPGIMGALMGLPRADKSLSDRQKVLVEEASQSGKKVMLFTHFTLINYDLPFPLCHQTKKFSASDSVFTDFTKGTFSRGRDWLYPKLNNGIHYTLAGHSHRSGVYRLKNVDPSAMSAIGYQPSEYEKLDSVAAGLHAELFKNPTTSRIAVSSCGGPIGVQNLEGELYGWNLMPPSGTLIDIEANGSLEFQRIVTKTYAAGKPRFCVALDYIQVHAKKQVISWIPMGENGHYWLVVGNILDAGRFIKNVTFHVWDTASRSFNQFKSGIAPAPNHSCVYDSYIANHDNFFIQALPALNGKTGRPVFVQIDFDDGLKAHRLYGQYNFQDPWIFGVDVKRDGKLQPLITPADGIIAEVPDWLWLAAVDPERYPQPARRQN